MNAATEMPSPLNFSDSAAAKVKDLIAEEGNPDLKLRVFVTGGGCPGFQSGFTFAGAVNGDEESGFGAGLGFGLDGGDDEADAVAEAKHGAVDGGVETGIMEAVFGVGEAGSEREIAGADGEVGGGLDLEVVHDRRWLVGRGRAGADDHREPTAQDAEERPHPCCPAAGRPARGPGAHRRAAVPGDVARGRRQVREGGPVRGERPREELARPRVDHRGRSRRCLAGRTSGLTAAGPQGLRS